MSWKKSLKKIKEDLSFLKDYWVVLYGSYVRNEFTRRSDIDVAVITRKKGFKENVSIFKKLQQAPPPYDIRIFELLPLHIKMEIFKKYIVLFGDPLEISEYMYSYYRIWRDMEFRIRENRIRSVEDIIRGIRRRKLFQT